MSTATCPFCCSTVFWVVRRGHRKCRHCRKEWTPHRYPVTGIRSQESEWRACIRIFLRERTLLAVVHSTAIPRSRAHRMMQHLRNRMAREVPPIFSGVTELDETYIGGQRKNKRLHIRKIQAKRGHGTDKLPIVGLLNRTSGQAYVEVLPKKLDMPRITEIVTERIAVSSSIYTDGFKMYRSLPKHGYRHEWVDHDGGEYVRGDVHTNNIEGFWGILKRKLGCIGGMRREYLYLFVGEIVWRFNHRNQSLLQQERALLKLVIGQ